MLWLGSWIVLLGFWFYVLRLAGRDSIYLALAFIILWGIARFGFSQLGLEGPIYFISYSALLTIIMIFIDLYRQNMGLRNPPTNPLEELGQKD